MIRTRIWTLILLLALTTAAWAFPTPEQKCQNARLFASAKYLSCHQRTLGRFSEKQDVGSFQFAMSRCRVK